MTWKQLRWMAMPFPQYVIDYLTPLGFELETESRLSFIPEYKWEKFSLSITDCNHYSFKIFHLDQITPKRIIFAGFKINNTNELTYLLSSNAEFAKIWEKLTKTSLHLL